MKEKKQNRVIEMERSEILAILTIHAQDEGYLLPNELLTTMSYDGNKSYEFQVEKTNAK